MVNCKVSNDMRTWDIDNHRNILANEQIKTPCLDGGALEGFRPGNSSVTQARLIEKKQQPLRRVTDVQSAVGQLTFNHPMFHLLSKVAPEQR